MAKLFIIAGTKGGIGKTFVATLLCDVALEAGHRVVLFDCDDENRSLRSSYRDPPAGLELEEVALDSDQEVEYPLDHIINRVMDREEENQTAGKETVYIADMKAGTSFRTISWMSILPFDLFRKRNIQVNLLGVVTSEIDSVATFALWVKTYLEEAKKGNLRLLVVQNEFQQNNFEFFTQKLAPMLMPLPDFRTIRLGMFMTQNMKRIRAMHTTLGRVASQKTLIPEFQFMDELRCNSYFAEVRQSLLPLFTECVKMPEPSERKGGKNNHAV